MAAYASSQYWSGYTIENEIKSPGHPSITGGTGTEYATLLYSNVTTSGYGTVTSGSGATIVHSRTTNLHYCQWRDELDIFVGGTNRLTCSYFG
ncbi:hypothetical protein [Subtercola frigoramans]|uniref:Uncharacterized protein n=1 Tax=Subtercola frigoramans TaxID=120298 RepID=A0ABS2L7R1_9MICO|nr:hypothetical protein [Subtercola frigoramans]MBM7473128.1 hypothetical protein [Subtercola frigoramans]